MKRQLITMVCGLLAIQATRAQDNSVKLSLKECIEQALNNNLPVKQADLRVETAEVNYKQAKADMLPDLNGNFGYGFNQGRSVDPITNSYISQHLASSNVNLSSGVTLFNGLRLQNFVRQNKYTYEASKMDGQQVKDNLTLNVILAYLQVLSNEDGLNIAKGQLDVTRKQVERMDVLVKEGAVGAYQLADLRGQQANEEINIINLENNLQQSKLALGQLMNIDYNPNMQLERTDTDSLVINYPMASAEVIQSSFQNLALVKANDLKIKSAEKGVKVATGGFYPTVSLNANMGSRYSNLARSLLATNQTEVSTGDYVIVNSTQTAVLRRQQNYSTEKIGYTKQLNNNLGTFAGINVAVPLFNNFFMRNRVKLAKISLKNTELESDRVKLELKQSIEQEWLNMNSSFNRYKILLQQEKDFAESFRSAQIRFNNGVINAYEFLLAKNNLDRSRVNLSQVRYDYIFRTKLLDFYAGKQLW
ncbi:MAG: TolC family protein [Chitinophagaceae bacterium]